MGLTVKCVQGDVFVNGQQVQPGGNAPTSGSQSDFLDLSINTASQAQVFDSTNTLALTVSTTPPSTNTAPQPQSPPASSFYSGYYSGSYRWQLKCPGGSIGIRL
jgi:hypothetical protein